MCSSGLQNGQSPLNNETSMEDFVILDEFFENIDFSLMESNNLASPALLDEKFITMKEIGGNVFLRAQVFKKNVKVHIRKFLINQDTTVTATPEGVCFDLTTFFRFLLKIDAFNLEYTHTSFIANNNLLILNEDGKCFLQEMKSLKHITLDFYQLQSLKTVIHEFSQKLLDFLFIEYLPLLISMRIPVSENCSEEDFVLFSRIISCIEDEISYNILKKEFICEGCVVNHPSQLRHECMKIRDLHKFQQIGQFCLMCINFDEVVKKFHQQSPVITRDFLHNFTLDSIVDVLFKTPQDL